jgi:type VI secretion system protein ImpA
MNARDVDEWLRDTEVEPPCGPNLEYDEQFVALASAAAGKPEQQYGETLIPAVDPDWESVVAQATRLLERSKDLRTTVLLTRALTRVEGVAGLARGLMIARQLLERHWDDVHPRVVYDGAADPFLRATALNALADAGGLVRDLRAATLLTTSAGPLTVRAAEATLRHEKTSTGTIGEPQLRQAAVAALNTEDAPIRSIAVALEHCNAIAALVGERMTGEDAPDLAPLQSLLETVQRLVPAADGNGAANASEAGESSAGAETTIATLEPGGLRTRRDALRMLDSVCEFLERSEPSNPAPLLIRRAQRLIGSGFLDIMRDMAPESLGHIEIITGQGHPQHDSETAQ